jgi:hypothetical protein
MTAAVEYFYGNFTSKLSRGDNHLENLSRLGFKLNYLKK